MVFSAMYHLDIRKATTSYSRIQYLLARVELVIRKSQNMNDFTW